MKYLIALQYWDGDRKPALELLELFSKTIGDVNRYADLCIYYRFDATPPNTELVDKLRNSFENVYVVKGRNHLTGYPDGSNGLWESLAMDAWIHSTQSNIGEPLWKKYKAILSIESDVCPISKDWLRILSEEWDNNRPAVVMGAWSPVGEYGSTTNNVGHINGNMMFAMNIHKIVPILIPPLGKAWDTYFAKDFKKAGWAITEKIINWFNQKTITRADFKKLLNGGVAILHGIKDGSTRKFYLETYDL